MSGDGLFEMEAREPLVAGEQVIVELVHDDVWATVVRTGVAEGFPYVRVLWWGEQFDVSPGHVRRGGPASS